MDLICKSTGLVIKECIFVCPHASFFFAENSILTSPRRFLPNIALTIPPQWVHIIMHSHRYNKLRCTSPCKLVVSSKGVVSVLAWCFCFFSSSLPHANIHHITCLQQAQDITDQKHPCCPPCAQSTCSGKKAKSKLCCARRFSFLCRYHTSAPPQRRVWACIVLHMFKIQTPTRPSASFCHTNWLWHHLATICVFFYFHFSIFEKYFFVDFVNIKAVSRTSTPPSTS